MILCWQKPVISAVELSVGLFKGEGSWFVFKTPENRFVPGKGLEWKRWRGFGQGMVSKRQWEITGLADCANHDLHCPGRGWHC